ncbi:MAG: hypothetical protein LKF33_06290 [Prevotella sp.]|jgi:hypothetical protein|nr:hypothetical protein [Prevotella sp.]
MKRTYIQPTTEISEIIMDSYLASGSTQRKTDYGQGGTNNQDVTDQGITGKDGGESLAKGRISWDE